ncbi:tannase/feruloyl esterase family alpha/beta hydrolase [Variovorax ginsengisoli]|uniref:Tannase/feruloyl esterase family alpha/beta hydrolase n=2 Tax=Variovorax guangxiensis TaxID=1775474 RepID=A0A502DTB5_9BURK|nr:tannase/feruloyl esterase family alpha/beta hydrolase [Variovorax ginsengisoli]TPG27426.1 tannase/feruloyl esterase family alpha/beta hydrolase [Variovorax guangxiensis]
MVAAVPASGPTPAMPDYCKVTARIAPKLNFEMRLPTNWNGKLHYSGGGGFNGSIPPVDASSLSLGYVDVSSDSGHTGSGIDASFAVNDPVALENFAQLSVPTVATTAKAITTTAYGQAPSRSYFEGCSNGGREGLMTALRFPTMFDGVIAKAPARQFIGQSEVVQRTARLVALPGGNMTPGKWTTLGSAVLGACDGLDGVADGIIANVSACTAAFNLSSLRCTGGGDTGDACLSDAQIAGLTAQTSPTVGSGGTSATPYVNSFSPYHFWGEEASQSGGSWPTWYPQSNPAFPGLASLFARSVVDNLLSTTPLSDWLSYDFKANSRLVETLTAQIDVTDTDLRPFASAGGKLLVWQGTSDIALSPQGTIDYVSGVKATVGSNADAFMRFYLAPNVQHCSGGAGADQTTALLPALDAWVASKTAPGDLTAAKLNASGAPVLSRPLCRYPTFAKYNGTGNVNDASSFACSLP